MNDKEFEEWYNLFVGHVREGGYQADFDEMDKEWAYDEWMEFGRQPDDAAAIYIDELKVIVPEAFFLED